MVDFSILTEKLAEIRQKITFLIGQVNTVTKGEPFYGRITTEGGHITGLIQGLEIKDYQLHFVLTKEKRNGDKTIQETEHKEIALENLIGIDTFQTIERKPIFVSSQQKGESL